jgi:hypothetical protein
MAMHIDPNWNFEEVVTAAYKFYLGSGVMARRSQFNVIRNWGNVVGKKRAVGDLRTYIGECKTKKEAADDLGISVSTCRVPEFLS